MSGQRKKLEVWFHQAPEQDRIVGHLVEQGGRMFFEYAPSFLREPLWLSPFKLPPEPGLIEHRDLDLGPIFGLFDDSLPDGWGLLLMDRYFRGRGARLAEVSVLDRLAYLGTRTMGALTYHPPSNPADGRAELLNLHEMARAADEVMEGAADEVLPQLLRVGGSPGGARPKVLVGVCDESLLSGEDDLPPGYAHWMVKFASRQDLPDAGPVEQAYAQMARAAGLTMSATRLFETAEGERFFGVERFDRQGNQRTHVHTFGNLIHADFRVPSCDYAQLLEVTRVLTRDHRDVVECYRRMVFNVLGHNRDDHVKNFAFRLRADGAWELAPAYDLIFAEGPGGEHSTTIAGEGRAPERRHLLKLAEPVGLERSEAKLVIDEVVSAVVRWHEHARDAGVSHASRQSVGRAIETCLGRLRQR